jgi:hypothetical protein
MNRAIALAFLLTAAPSCGFKPIYSKTPNADFARVARAIHVPPVKGYDGAAGVEMRNNLLRSLGTDGRPEVPAYRLEVSVTEPQIVTYTIDLDGTASAYMVHVSARYSLFEAGSASTEAISSSASYSVPYNILKDKYSTETLKQQAISICLKNISDLISAAVISHLNRR